MLGLKKDSNFFKKRSLFLSFHANTLFYNLAIEFVSKALV